MNYSDHFSEFGEYERHLNNVQFVLRGLASTWVLAATAASGAVLTNSEITSWTHPYTDSDLLAGISAIASLGIAALWLLDQYVYHRLLNGVFLVGLGLELHDANVLPLRMGMIHRTPEGASRMVAWFYRICLIALACPVAVASSIYRTGWMPVASLFLFIAVLLFIGRLRANASGKDAVGRVEFGSEIKDFWNATTKQRTRAITERFVKSAIRKEGTRARRVVLTGGEGSGKSSILESLDKRGVRTLGETAIDILMGLTSEMTAEQARQLRASDMTEFQRRVAKEQIFRELAEQTSELVVQDRGVHDGIAYCMDAEVKIPIELLAIAMKTEYDIVFVLETLHDFKARPETGRAGTYAESVQSGQTLEKMYRSFGFRTYRVPEFSNEKIENVKRRVRFILDVVEKRQKGTDLFTDPDLV